MGPETLESSDRPLLDVIQDKTGMKGTGKWTVQQGAELSVPTPTMDAFIAAASTVKHGDAGAVQYASSRVPADPGTTEITYDTRFAPLEVFKFDEGALGQVLEGAAREAG